MFKKTKLRFLSFLMAVVMMLTMLPAAVYAKETKNVYISVSKDGKYINDQDGVPMTYIPVSFDDLASVDLNEYGLSEYLYDENGDGSYENTALQLIIYAHENLYGGDWSNVDFTGAPGSSYFQGGIFGFDENLNYYLNGQYPLAGAGWGATSDQIVLKAGDFIDLAAFTSWDFYQDSSYGFHFFADENGKIIHDYTADAGKALDVKLIKGTKDYEYNSVFFDVSDYEIFYGTDYGNESGTVTTDENGCASITFPSAGIYYLWVDGGYGNEYPETIVSAPGYATVTVTAAEKPAPEDPETSRDAQDVSSVLDATMTKLAATVTEPAFGTNAGEWTVLSLARGGYYKKDHEYFRDYYDRIVETVNKTAVDVNMNGALHKSKSTENSRLIVALSALGKDAASVGDWDLVEAYDVNGFSWIKKQGLNGTIWALIALDSNNYETTTTDKNGKSIRQQCVDAILEAQHNDGGWALQANLTYASDPDVTGMALTALYPYRDQPEVKTACEEAFACLSEMQHDNGTFASGGSECSESCAWVIVSAATWGINPDTDARFIKNGKSVVDGLLDHYLEDEAEFQHIIGAGSNNMATDQSCYALVAYDRLLKNKPALYDYSDVVFEDAAAPNVPAAGDMALSLGLPKYVNSKAGTGFNAVLSINKWDNDAQYKVIDFIMSVPENLAVTAVTAGSNLNGGEVSYHLETDTNKLRAVYMDTSKNNDLTVDGETFPTELFTIRFEVEEDAGSEISQFDISVDGMSVKTSSDSSDSNAMTIVDTEKAYDSAAVVSGVTYSAVCLYTGDDVDLIPSTKKAVAVAVTGIKNAVELTYDDGTNTIAFQYSPEITDKTGVDSYVALVDASIAMENFIDKDNFTLNEEETENLIFGDSNGDNVVNAQDALAVVNFWIRKGDAPKDDQILALNVNGDSRLNTFDALGIVEAFVNNSEYTVVTKAATLATNS